LGDLSLISQILGFGGKIWGTSAARDPNAAPDFFGSPNHVL